MVYELESGADLDVKVLIEGQEVKMRLMSEILEELCPMNFDIFEKLMD